MALDDKYEEFVSSLSKVPPVPCVFSIGDTVTYTNDYDVSFPGMVITGFDYEQGKYDRFIYMDKEAYWYPVSPSSLTLEKKAS